jgi:uncharacterized protein (TIGR02246 family)
MMRSKLGSVFPCIIALVTACSRPPNEANADNATPSPQKTMTIEENKRKNEAAIRELIDGFVKAIRAKDINKVISVFAPEMVSFDLGLPLQHGGGKTFVNRWQELLESYQNPIDYEVRDLSITAGDDVAFSHSLNRVSGTMKSGQKSDRWLRWTACYRKTNGKRLIVHEHVSVPVDLGNGKGMLDLKP